MERRESSLYVCGVKKDAIKNQVFVSNNQGCLDISFDRVIDFIGSIAITGQSGSGELL
jgi:hypothetical protein